MTGHLKNHDKEDGQWLNIIERWVSSVVGRACLLAGDDSQTYWLYKRLADGTIIVLDNSLRFFHVTGVSNEDGRTKAVKRLVAKADGLTKKEEMDLWLQPTIMEAKERFDWREREREEAEEDKRKEKLERMVGAVPNKTGSKWGLKLGGRIVVPPLYRAVKTPVDMYCAVEKNYKQWGIIALDGKMVVEPKYEDVEIFEDGTAELTVYKGKRIRLMIDV